MGNTGQIKSWLCAVLFVTAAFCSASQKPNIIVFLIDDMGVMDTSVPFLTGPDGTPVKHPLNEWYRTPGMERLAETGIRFNQFCAQSVCSPSRISLLTGQNATRHGTTTWINPKNDNRGRHGPMEWSWKGLEASDPTLARVLQEAGYRTIHIGKAHLGPKDSVGADPLKVGFEINVGGGPWGQPKSYYAKDHFGFHEKYVRKGQSIADVDHAVPHLEKYHGSDQHLTEALTLEAQRLIREAVNDEKPFFLHFAHYAVHAPFQAHQPYLKNYEGRSTREQVFASMIEGMDQSLSDVLDTVEELGAAGNTLVIFLGDNGSDAPMGDAYSVGSAAPLRGKKATQYEGGMRVPFIASWAKPDAKIPVQQALPIQSGAIQPQLATIMDIYPTVLELCGVTPPQDHMVDGASLKKLFTGKADPAHPKTFLMHYPHEHRNSYFTAYRTQDWKLIYNYGLPGRRYPDSYKPAPFELYHLKEDPAEQVNLVDKHPERLNEMMKAMVRQLEEEQALFPVDEAGSELNPVIP